MAITTSLYANQNGMISNQYQDNPWAADTVTKAVGKNAQGKYVEGYNLLVEANPEGIDSRSSSR